MLVWSRVLKSIKKISVDLITCPLAEDVDNARRLNDAFYVGAIVTYQCYYGYALPNKQGTELRIVCLPSGEWSAQTIGCESMNIIV